jgi:hypothetical protein
MASINNWPIPAIPMMAAASAVGIAQIAAVHAAKPKLQTFADGGIVPGNSFRGDNILTRQNSGEMDINRQDQQRLWNAIKSGNFGDNNDIPITIHNVIELDGEVLSEKIFEINARGNSFVKSRGVVQ